MILAPVPLVHLESAQAIGHGSHVAFSTSQTSFPPEWLGRHIYFYASAAGYAGSSADIRKVPFRGVLVRHLLSSSGFYDGDAIRPASTATDSASLAFFEVADFEKLAKPLLIGQFAKADGGRYAAAYTPRRPIASRLSE
ncbi:hypothetical protein FHS55_000096 [Angulomicrobium tetraedrale]|uniref:Uncharacterized protein n=1 Tax=Ancylobacter tetraedralis TaxID=217068 RepID=A0A839Z4V9_9HYPH|nr:hypothetical protein [Ancylobacter tetraedralis]MBB3769510.1 hypothetical protein [Ancylobacter tetraedralis]